MELSASPHRSFARNRIDRALRRHRRGARTTGILSDVCWSYHRADAWSALCALGACDSAGHLLVVAGDAAGPQTHRVSALAPSLWLEILRRDPGAYAAMAPAVEATRRGHRDFRTLRAALRPNPGRSRQWSSGAGRRLPNGRRGRPPCSEA